MTSIAAQPDVSFTRHFSSVCGFPCIRFIDGLKHWLKVNIVGTQYPLFKCRLRRPLTSRGKNNKKKRRAVEQHRSNGLRFDGRCARHHIVDLKILLFSHVRFKATRLRTIVKREREREKKGLSLWACKIKHLQEKENVVLVFFFFGCFARKSVKGTFYQQRIFMIWRHNTQLSFRHFSSRKKFQWHGLKP